MPGPFPGMDPYLENPVIWPGVHSFLAVCCSTELNKLLPEPYVADIGERVYVEQAARSIYPDVFLKKGRSRSGKANGSARTALADPPWELEISPQEIREPFVNVLDVRDQQRIVTSIEFLSPTNKVAGSEGRKKYRRKQREVVRSRTHLVEIDLLRHGEHTVHAPWHQLKRYGDWDYLVCCSRHRQRDRVQVWAVTMQHRLPRILIPLAGKDGDIVLDLQKLFDQVYDQNVYARKIDYRADPTEPFTKQQEKWADRLLRKRGLRA